MIEIITTRLDGLVPDPNNARAHDEKNLASIRSSLALFGQVEPLVVQKSTGIIIAGNGRRIAMLEQNKEAEQLGSPTPWETVRVVFVDIDDGKRKAMALALNRTAELANWNEKQLVDSLTALLQEEYDIADIGWSKDDFENLTKQFEVDEADMPDLTGADSPFAQVTFTLTHDQMATCRAALDISKGNGDMGDTGNPNGNGNAAARIFGSYIESQQDAD